MTCPHDHVAGPKSMGPETLVTQILKITLFCIQQKKEIHTGLEHL